VSAAGPLARVHGSTFIVRPPVPATVNKAGANYKSEVTHLEYSPRQAYAEWLSICDGIRALGGDAVFDFEAADEPFLDVGDLEVDGAGAIHPLGSKESLGQLGEVMTGRVFTANGPWLAVDGNRLVGAMPNMLSHRRAEQPYYRQLCGELADAAGLAVAIADTPDRWEGMADVAVVGDRVVLTYAVSGHYDEGLAPKSPRSSREGVAFAADAVGVPESQRIYVELVYPHFHGDTVHFGARPPGGDPVLVHYPGGLWRSGSTILTAALGGERIVPIGRTDAVDGYAGNSRQVERGVLVPDGASADFDAALGRLGLAVHRVALFELFGKAGGGPACATLYLPADLAVPTAFSRRFSVREAEARSRLDRLPARLVVDPAYFAGKTRG
jgi:hypothetical protein